jgi:hypothetical protein
MQIAVIPVSIATPRHFVTATEIARNNNVKTSAYVTRSCQPDQPLTRPLVPRYTGKVCHCTHDMRRATGQFIPCFLHFSFLFLSFFRQSETMRLN